MNSQAVGQILRLAAFDAALAKVGDDVIRQITNAKNRTELRDNRFRWRSP